MGVRAGQGYGARKPKRGLCPACHKHGMTQWRATADGMLRWCQYCQHSEGQGIYDIAHPNHRKMSEGAGAVMRSEGNAVEYEFTVRKRSEGVDAAIVVAEDGLEAVSKAYPDLDFETIDVEGDKTYVLDLAGNAIYIATRGKPIG